MSYLKFEKKLIKNVNNKNLTEENAKYIYDRTTNFIKSLRDLENKKEELKNKIDRINQENPIHLGEFGRVIRNLTLINTKVERRQQKRFYKILKILSKNLANKIYKLDQYINLKNIQESRKNKITEITQKLENLNLEKYELNLKDLEIKQFKLERFFESNREINDTHADIIKRGLQIHQLDDLTDSGIKAYKILKIRDINEIINIRNQFEYEKAKKIIEERNKNFPSLKSICIKYVNELNFFPDNINILTDETQINVLANKIHKIYKK